MNEDRCPQCGEETKTIYISSNYTWCTNEDCDYQKEDYDG